MTIELVDSCGTIAVRCFCEKLVADAVYSSGTEGKGTSVVGNCYQKTGEDSKLGNWIQNILSHKLAY
jgi:hypothetical protein